MSKLAFGVINTDQYLSYKERELMTFSILEYTIKNKINITFDSNVINVFSELKGVDRSNSILFRITDNPSEEVAHNIFSESDFGVIIKGERVDNNESLKCRMNKISKILSYIFSFKKVTSIEFYVNVEEGDEYKTYNIKENCICDEILKLYKQSEEENIWISFKLNIVR